MIAAAGAAAGTAAAAGALASSAHAQDAAAKRKIIGVSFSQRKGKTTAAALTLCLDAAREQDPAVETELIELADYSIPAQLAAGLPLRDGETDDYPALAKKLSDPAVAGIIFGSPTYFSNMSALGKAFLDRGVSFRKGGFALRNKAAGVLAVGGSRNGGQEFVIRSIQTVLMCQDMIVVGCGKPAGRSGAILWSQDNSIEGDKLGVAAAKSLGRRVAELAAMMA